MLTRKRSPKDVVEPVGEPLLGHGITLHEAVVTINGGYSITSPRPGCEQVCINSLLSMFMFQVPEAHLSGLPYFPYCFGWWQGNVVLDRQVVLRRTGLKLDRKDTA
jgi:hypothetical protein